MVSADTTLAAPIEIVLNDARAGLAMVDTWGMGTDKLLRIVLRPDEFLSSRGSGDRDDAAAVLVFRDAVDAQIKAQRERGIEKPVRRTALLAAFLSLSLEQRAAVGCISALLTDDECRALRKVASWQHAEAGAAVTVVELLDDEQRRALFRSQDKQRLHYNLGRLLTF